MNGRDFNPLAKLLILRTPDPRPFWPQTFYDPRPFCRIADGFNSTGKVVNGLANGDNSGLIENGSGEGASRIQKAVLTTANIQNIPRNQLSGAVIDSWSYVTGKVVEFRVGLEQKPEPEPESESKK